MAKVIFRNSDFREYRVPFYDSLCKKHQVRFIFRYFKAPEKYDYISVREGRSFFTDRKFLCDYMKLLLSDFDVFITSLPSHPISFLGILIAKLRFKKVIIWMEEWLEPSKRGIKRKWKFLLYKQALYMADAFYVTSTKAEKFLKSLIKRKNSVVFKTLQANTDMSLFTPKSPHLFVPKDHIVFLYFGRIIKWKGLDILIESFGKVNLLYKNCTLLVVGDGDFKEECIELVRAKKISNVIFERAIDDCNNELKAGFFGLCDVFVLPSTIINDKAEGWGLTVGEAMSLGKPIIVTDAVGCCDDLVEEGVNGFIAKHGSVESMTNVLLEVIKHKNILINMGNKSRDIFEQKIHPAAMAIALSDAIDFINERKL